MVDPSNSPSSTTPRDAPSGVFEFSLVRDARQILAVLRELEASDPFVHRMRRLLALPGFGQHAADVSSEWTCAGGPDLEERRLTLTADGFKISCQPLGRAWSVKQERRLLDAAQGAGFFLELSEQNLAEAPFNVYRIEKAVQDFLLQSLKRSIDHGRLDAVLPEAGAENAPALLCDAARRIEEELELRKEVVLNQFHDFYGMLYDETAVDSPAPVFVAALGERLDHVHKGHARLTRPWPIAQGDYRGIEPADYGCIVLNQSGFHVRPVRLTNRHVSPTFGSLRGVLPQDLLCVCLAGITPKDVVRRYAKEARLLLRALSPGDSAIEQQLKTIGS